MATNPYFRSNYNAGNSDQILIEDLLVESIKIYGLDCEFVPYELVNEDRIYGEDTMLQYMHSYPLEMYVESIQGFEGQGDFLSKFNLQIEDKANLMVSIRRFRQATNYTMYRPREKDLVYFPLTDSLYEITYVEHEKIFHQVGALQVYSLRIDLMNYANQKIRTGVREIDKFENLKGFADEFTMGPEAGRYIMGETVYQGTDLAHATAKAMVIFYDRDRKLLKVKDVIGKFDNTQSIIGNTSGAVLSIASFDEKELPNEPVSDNKKLKDEVAPILDWSVENPFGDPRK